MEEPIFYYHPVSYYSQKVLIALHEKKVKFKGRLIDIFNGDQLTEDFLQINPNGEVPVWKNGENCVADSDVIIDIIDKGFPSGPKLVPAVERRLWRDVHELRRCIQNIPIDVLTYGLLANRDLCVSDIKFPQEFQEANTREHIERKLSALEDHCREQLKTCPTYLVKSFRDKMVRVQMRKEKVLNKTEVVKCLYRIEAVIDKLYEKLEKSTKESQKPEVFLCGTEVTAADVSAIIFMYRLETMGVSSRYYSSDLRPALLNYRNRMMERPSVKRTIALAENADETTDHVPATSRNVGKTVLKIALVVGVAVIGYFGYRRIVKHGFPKSWPFSSS